MYFCSYEPFFGGSKVRKYFFAKNCHFSSGSFMTQMTHMNDTYEHMNEKRNDMKRHI